MASQVDEGEPGRVHGVNPMTTQCLHQQEVLVLDCQTTSSSSSTGQLLEVAWCRCRGGETDEVCAHLVTLPEPETLSPRISRLTGITSSDLEVGGRTPAEIWGLLQAEARRMAPAGGNAALAVAHVARFERSFLEPLHRSLRPEEPFPLDLLCTHEIACRLLPGLPRRGLRALAGFLGHPVQEERRAAGHVRATALVWGELVRRLAAEAGVETLVELRDWLERVPPVRRGGREFPLPREVRLGLPRDPGVYRMLDRQGEVLYVGKATSLHSRVNSYFQKRRYQVQHTPELLTQTFDLRVTVTGSPLEAALLEVDEIKALAPRYNVVLRQREGGTTWFATEDLGSLSPRPDERHRLGPLADPGLVQSWQLLLQLLAGSMEPGAEAWSTLLWTGGERPDAAELLREGVRCFRERHELPDADAMTAGVLRELGHRLWQEARRAAAEAADAEKLEGEEPDETAGGEEAAPAIETPADVARGLERLAYSVAWQLQRGRWLCQLTQCSLAWQPPGQPAGSCRLLLVDRGQPVRQEARPGKEAPPAPPHHTRSLQERLECLDLVTHDRLRVLTGELRRLQQSGTWVSLRLDAGAPLEGEDLGARLC